MVFCSLVTQLQTYKVLLVKFARRDFKLGMRFAERDDYEAGIISVGWVVARTVCVCSVIQTTHGSQDIESQCRLPTLHRGIEGRSLVLA